MLCDRLLFCLPHKTLDEGENIVVHWSWHSRTRDFNAWYPRCTHTHVPTAILEQFLKSDWTGRILWPKSSSPLFLWIRKFRTPHLTLSNDCTKNAIFFITFVQNDLTYFQYTFTLLEKYLTVLILQLIFPDFSSIMREFCTLKNESLRAIFNHCDNCQSE